MIMINLLKSLANDKALSSPWKMQSIEAGVLCPVVYIIRFTINTVYRNYFVVYVNIVTTCFGLIK
jgi:hypothetical protein